MLHYINSEGGTMSAPDDLLPGLAVHDHKDCVRRALQEADARCARDGLKFTGARRRTLEILLESHVALGAYDVLARLAADGLGSKPPIAYRALGFLVEHGFAHRVERLNAFVACARPGTAHQPAFMICTDCGTVAETATAPLRGALGKSARDHGFRIDSTVLEAQGVCAGCRTGSSAETALPTLAERSAARGPRR